MTAPTIVCGVDGSDNASAAVAFARILSEWLEWRLVLVHVAHAPVIAGAGLVPGSYDELGNIAREEGDELLDAVIDEHDLPRTVERLVEVGDRVEKLVAVSEQENADLLVVGAPGRGRIATALFGSVATGVLGVAPCPVAVVPKAVSMSWLVPRPSPGRSVPAVSIFSRD